MTFLTFGSTDQVSCNAVPYASFQFVVVLFVDAVEPVFLELNFAFAVAVNTPAHAEVAELLHLVHFMNLAMAGLALHLTYRYVL